MRKGQIGIEVLAMMGLVLAISTIILFGINERNINVETARQQLAAQKEVEKVANAINSAAIGGEGFETNLTVSKKAGTADADVFNVRGKGRKVEMRWQSPRNETLVTSVRLLTAKVKDADLKTARINVNNTGDNIEVKCWNAAETSLSNC